MPQFERRLYEPSDDAQAFDSDEDIEDEGSRLPLLIGIALVVLLSFAGVVWLAYTQGVERGRSDAPRVVAESDSVAAVRKPPPYSKLKIYQSPKADEDVAGAEPAPSPTKTTPPTVADTKTDASSSTPELKSTLSKPAPVAAKPVTPSPVAKGRASAMQPATGAPRVITPPPTAAKAAKSPAPSTVKAPATKPLSAPAKSNPDHAVKTDQQSKAAAIKTSAKAASATLIKTAPVKTAPVKTATAKSDPASAAPEKPSTPTPATKLAAINPAPKTSPATTTAKEPAPEATKSAGGYVLQIGSYKSDAEANASWQTYKGAHSSVAGYSSDVRKVELGAKGTWYRLRIGPFADLSEANAACAKLKAQGGNCFPAKQ